MRLELPRALADKVHVQAVLATGLSDGWARRRRASVGRVYPRSAAGRSAVVPIPDTQHVVGRRVGSRCGRRAAGARRSRRFVETSASIDYVTIIVGQGCDVAGAVNSAPTTIRRGSRYCQARARATR